MPDAQRPNHVPIYRAYRVNPGGRVSSAPVILDARDDEEAVAQARALVDGTGVEVWDRTRRLVALPPRGEGEGGTGG